MRVKKESTLTILERDKILRTGMTSIAVVGLSRIIRPQRIERG